MRNKKNQLIIYLFLSVLIILNVCLYASAKISFSGYWSDRVIFWIWFLATPLIVFSFWKKIWAKIYFWLLVLGLILSILPMALPFFGIMLSTTGSGRLSHFSLENNIRVQIVGYGVLGRPQLQIVKDGFLFDKIKLETIGKIKKNDSTWLQLLDAKNAKFISETDTSITIKYYFEKDTVQTVHELKDNTAFIY